MVAGNKNSERIRIREAYLQMAETARYRPQAPSDGLGNIELSPEELEDSERLAREASEYAVAFVNEEDTRQFHIGVSNYATNRAFVYTIEAARALCSGKSWLALRLLEMAIEDVKQAERA